VLPHSASNLPSGAEPMPSQPIPRLMTERLILRAPVADDFPAYAQLLASPRAAGMGGPHALRAAWGMFCHEVAGWALFGHGALMIDLRTTGECVGQVGISHGPRYPEKELGWLVYEGHEGRGYATEAAAALRDWAARTLSLDRLVSYIDPENIRSIAVAERLGAALDLSAPKQDPGDLVYRHRAGTTPP
jgi:RimJ/RimL family protein N-acetyltransferase